MHIYEWYHQLWLSHKCLAWNLLQRGHYQCAVGLIRPENNLYG